MCYFLVIPASPLPLFLLFFLVLLFPSSLSPPVPSSSSCTMHDTSLAAIPLMELVPVSLVYGLTMVLGSLGNALVIISFCRSRRLQNSTNVFLSSLATAPTCFSLASRRPTCSSSASASQSRYDPLFLSPLEERNRPVLRPCLFRTLCTYTPGTWNLLSVTLHYVAIHQAPAAKTGAFRDGDVHLVVCLLVFRLKYVLVGHWLAWPGSASGRSVARPTAPRVSVIFTPCSSPREIYASGGGLLIAPINVQHLFMLA